MEHRIGRQELYDLVWKVPVQQLAERFDISDVGLAKACKKADIPRPPRGYWRKVQCGKRVKRKPLPKRTSDTPFEISIGNVRYWQPAEETEKPALELSQNLEQELADVSSIKVPKTLSGAHPIIENWLDDERRDKERWRYSNSGWSPKAKSKDEMALERRKYRILSALFKALEAQRFDIQIEHGRRWDVGIYCDLERVEFVCEEHVRQYRRELNEEEKKDNYHGSYKRKWRQIKEPTGRLKFKFKRSFGSDKVREWLETEEEPLESNVGDIAQKFIQARVVLRREAEARQEAEAKRFEEERARWREEEKIEEEQARVTKLIEDAEAWRSAENVRAYVKARGEAVDKEQFEAEDGALEVWTEWALKSADEFDPTSNY